MPLNLLWEIMSCELNFIHKVYSARIHSFVLMNNHFHLLISTPEANIDKCLWHFMLQTSLRINSYVGKVNQVFGNRHYKCLIDSYLYFQHAYKYVYRNPVKAELCLNCEDYPFSTLSGLLGQRHLFIPLEEDSLLFGDTPGNLEWLNIAPSLEEWELVDLALHREKFVLAKNKSNKAHRLENDAF